MKIVLDSNHEKFGADIMSLDRLLTSLQAYRAKTIIKSPHMLATLNQWGRYLATATNSIVKANLEGGGPQLEFDFPFEEEFLKFLKEAGKQDAIIRGNNARPG